MNIKTLALSLALVAALFLSPPAEGQATLTSTTLSAAITNTQTSFNIASATGVVAPSFGVANVPSGNQTILFVDKEAMFVTAINGTYVTVIRGFNRTSAAPHASSAVVYLGPPSYFSDSDRYGYCVSTNEVVLPVINLGTGRIFDCRSSGIWMQIGEGTMQGGPSTPLRAACTGTAGSAETEFLNFAACSGATTATVRAVVNSAGTLANLRVYSSAAVTGGTNKDVLTVLKNGSATTLTCTIAASGTTCSDLTHSVAVAAGDVITFSFVSATSDTAANIAAVIDKY